MSEFVKCLTVSSGYADYFTVGETYVVDAFQISVTDNFSFDDEDDAWLLEVEGGDVKTVREHQGDKESPVIATFKKRGK